MSAINTQKPASVPELTSLEYDARRRSVSEPEEVSKDEGSKLEESGSESVETVRASDRMYRSDAYLAADF